MKGLIIDEPWITLILNGEKHWEMRSQTTAHRGLFALIRKGSGMVVGIAHLEGCLGPLSLGQLRAHLMKHRVPLEEFESGRASKWTTAWRLGRVRQLGIPIPYKHPAGAVVWVNLDPGVEAAAMAQFEDRTIRLARAHISIAAPSKLMKKSTVQPYWSLPAVRVPLAADGTWFGPHLLRAGLYTVGEKGDEQRFDNFETSLRYLAGMHVPRWRRPNPNGNWGIVSGRRWLPIGDLMR